MRANNDLEHPDITAAQLTGYPERKKRQIVQTCDICGETLDQCERFIQIPEISNLRVCESCVENLWKPWDYAIVEVETDG